MIKRLVDFFNTDGLLKDSSVMLVGMATAHVFNLLFQMFMGRRLAPEEFALLISMLGVFNVLTLPLTVISTALNRYSSLLIHEGRKGDIRRLIFCWGKWLVAIGIGLSLLCFIFPEYIASFFRFERTAPVYIFGIILSGIFCRPLINGALLGIQRFDGWCWGATLGAAIRLLVGGLLVIMVSPYSGWGLLGHGLGFYVTILLGGFILFRSLRGSLPTEKPLPQMQQFVFGSFFILLGYSFLMTGDVILVKNLFPESAGDFAYAAPLARLVLFAPQSLSRSMFPKVVSDQSGGKKVIRLLQKTMLVAFLGGAASAVFFSVFSKQILLFVFNIREPSQELMTLLPLLSWVMVLVAILNVIMRFAMAQHRLLGATVVPLAAVCYWISAAYLADSPTELLIWLAVLAAISILVLSWWIFAYKYQSESEGRHAE